MKLCAIESLLNRAAREVSCPVEIYKSTLFESAILNYKDSHGSCVCQNRYHTYQCVKLAIQESLLLFHDNLSK